MTRFLPIGILAPTLHRYERRAPLTPGAVSELVAQGIPVFVQLSPIRVFPSQAYREAGAEVVTELGDLAQVVFGVKQIPADVFKPGRAYVFFSHTHKGQPGNMNMLQTMIDRGSTLIDYERMVDSAGKRVIAFGEFAGMAGMTDALHLLGLRLEAQGIRPNPFSKMRQTIHYRGGVSEIKEQLRGIGEEIRKKGMPRAAGPLVVGFLGYGRVAGGAFDIFDALGPREITPQELREGELSRHQIYKVVFKEGDTVRKKRGKGEFVFDHYLTNPADYTSALGPFLPRLTVLVNGIYWEPGQPQLVTRQALRKLMREESDSRLRVIADISCDINGAIAATLMATTVEDPYFVYNPRTHGAQLGVEGEGLALWAVDTAPCELSRESSEHFSRLLLPLVPDIASADYRARYAIGIQSLPEVVRPAVVVWKGRLTPAYADNPLIRKGLKRYGRTSVYHDW